jgi:hypothetical protein
MADVKAILVLGVMDAFLSKMTALRKLREGIPIPLTILWK